MATATHGNIGEFNTKCEDWVSYTERLEQYFTANDIKPDQTGKRQAILLSVCGAATYQLIRNLVTPEKPTNKSFAPTSEACTRSPSIPTVRCPTLPHPST